MELGRKESHLLSITGGFLYIRFFSEYLNEVSHLILVLLRRMIVSFKEPGKSQLGLNRKVLLNLFQNTEQ